MVLCGHFERRVNKWEIFSLQALLLGVIEVNKHRLARVIVLCSWVRHLISSLFVLSPAVCLNKDLSI